MESFLVGFIMLSVVLLARADERPCIGENGREYAHGASFINDDGCNRCFCADGNIGCTRMLCVPPPPEGVCEYSGNQYNVGDSFMNADGCNTCVCGENGIAACTMKLC